MDIEIKGLTMEELEYCARMIISEIEEEANKMAQQKSINKNLCDSCITEGCIFQSGTVRNHCDFYKAESEDELKPCPFCDWSASIETFKVRKGYEANVQCDCCLASMATITYDTEEEARQNAIKAWNRRTK